MAGLPASTPGRKIPQTPEPKRRANVVSVASMKSHSTFQYLPGGQTLLARACARKEPAGEVRLFSYSETAQR